MDRQPTPIDAFIHLVRTHIVGLTLDQDAFPGYEQLEINLSRAITRTTTAFDVQALGHGPLTLHGRDQVRVTRLRKH